MPVAIANGKEFDFPEGTTPEQMGDAIDEFFSNASQQEFADIPTADDMPSPDAQVDRQLTGGDMITGAADLALGAGYGMGKEAVKGIGGLLAPSGQGAQNVEAIDRALPDYPVSRQGQQIVAALSEKYQASPQVVQSLISDFMNLGPSLGESAFQATEGLPAEVRGAAGALVGALPGAIEGATGLKGGKQLAKQGIDMPNPRQALDAPSRAAIGVTEALPPPTQAVNTVQAAIQKLSPNKQKIVKALQSGDGDNITAKYLLSPEGAVKADPLAKSAIKQGFDEGVIAAMKTGSAADKAAMREMTAIRKVSKANALKGLESRPAQIAGKSLMERFNAVMKANKKAGSEIDGVAKSLKGRPIESGGVVDDFISDLSSSLDVKVNTDGKVSLDFGGSVIEDNPAGKKIITELVNRMSRGGKPDAYELHRLKKYIDDRVTYGKTAEGLAGSSEIAVKKLRANIDDLLDNTFPEYDKVNTQYSETIGALDDFQQVMGSKVDLTGSRANEAVGRNLRKVMSNYNSREQLLDVIENIEGVAKKYGGDFDTNILLQTLYANELDNVFGPAARTSLRGEVSGAIRNATDAAQGRRGIVDVAADVAVGAAEKAQGINEENAFKAIDELLKR
mgnify:FL=1